MSQAIVRQVFLKTDITSSTTYTVSEYTVQPGDSLFSIAKQFNIKPETLLWANYDILQDSPDSLRVGQMLKIPPTDGVYYQGKQGDTLESIAEEFAANVDDILNWPGNNIDLTNPGGQTGYYVMVPGGHREFVQWIIPSCTWKIRHRQSWRDSLRGRTGWQHGLYLADWQSLSLWQ